MDCEMCGNDATVHGTVEGVRMALCESCARHASGVQRPTVTAPKRPVIARREEPEVMVRAEAPRLLREYREREGLTQDEFAGRLNIRTSVYQHFESGTRLPSIETARRLEKTIGKPLVVRVEVRGSARSSVEDEGLTLGDFVKRS